MAHVMIFHGYVGLCRSSPESTGAGTQADCGAQQRPLGEWAFSHSEDGRGQFTTKVPFC